MQVFLITCWTACAPSPHLDFTSPYVRCRNSKLRFTSLSNATRLHQVAASLQARGVASSAAACKGVGTHLHVHSGSLDRATDLAARPYARESPIPGSLRTGYIRGTRSEAATTQHLGVTRQPATRCMLILAVAAGESGVNPELSRNGVLVHVRSQKRRAQESVRGPAGSAPGRPVRVAFRRPGLVGWAGGRDAVRARGCPLPSTRPPCRSRESPT